MVSHGGGGRRGPLLVLHGGPGYPHDYLLTLEALATDRPVVFYDQLGCGRSDRPADVSLWRIPRFVRELARVRETLGLAELHLFGHSWGAMLAVDYLLDRPSGIRSVILASPALSIPRWLADAEVLRSALPPEVQQVLHHHEKAGTIDHLAYRVAAKEYYRRYLCRLDHWPELMDRSREAASRELYRTMWGPTEFLPIGNLRDYDRTGRLGEITVPALITCGRHDEATPEACAFYQRRMPSAELAVFESSSHMAHLEETDRFIATLRGFLARMVQ